MHKYCTGIAVWSVDDCINSLGLITKQYVNNSFSHSDNVYRIHVSLYINAKCVICCRNIAIFSSLSCTSVTVAC